MKHHALGSQGLQVSEPGLGCMNLSDPAVPVEDVAGAVGEPESELLPLCRSLGIGFVSCSPLGRRFLAGAAQHLDDQDYRHSQPRWQGAAFADIVPIPGTNKRHRLQENVDAARIQLTADELAAIENAVPANLVRGARYDAAGAALLPH